MAVIRDPAEKRLRALMMLEMRVRNHDLPSIAKEFNISTKTVQKNLTWARKAGLVADAEDKILKELVPAAHEALVEALKLASPADRGRLAIEIFKGTISGFKKETKTTVTSTGGDDLESYLAQLRASEPSFIEGSVEEIKSLPGVQAPEATEQLLLTSGQDTNQPSTDAVSLHPMSEEAPKKLPGT